MSYVAPDDEDVGTFIRRRVFQCFVPLTDIASAASDAFDVIPFSLGVVAVADDPRRCAATLLGAWRAADTALDAILGAGPS